MREKAKRLLSPPVAGINAKHRQSGGEGVSEEEFSQIPVLGEIVKRAHRNLNQQGWDFIAGGGESETSLLRNRLALDSLAFRPRVLRDVEHVEATAVMLGAAQRIPVMLAPMGGLQNIAAGGMAPALRAAARFGITAYVSSVVDPGLEDCRAEADGQMIYQLYTRGGPDWMFERFDRAREVGYQGICLTVDTAVQGRRDRSAARNFQPLTPSDQARRGSLQAGLDWDAVGQVRDRYDLKFILKGINTAAEVEHASCSRVRGDAQINATLHRDTAAFRFSQRRLGLGCAAL